MGRVVVLIFHPAPGADAGPLTRSLAAARRSMAEHHRRGFLAAGADEIRVVAGPPDDTPFGRRLRTLVAELEAQDGGLGYGLVVLGSGAVPLASRADYRRFVVVAASGERCAMANNRYSADAVAVGSAHALADLPDLDADNALPRWLDEVAGYAVADRRGSWRLAIDLDSPLDLALAARAPSSPADLRRGAARLLGPIRERLDAVAERLADPRAEVLVAGRTSTATLRWLETATAARIRALVEERGLRASSRLARADAPSAGPQRPPASTLAMVLDHEGPAALGAIVERLADAALIDTRVLLAHRLGPDERAWPSLEDRFASDLMLCERIVDPWLRDLTRAVFEASIPVLLGGHSLVGPGVRLVAHASVAGRRATRRAARRAEAP